jgi:hypothetical protein
LSARRRANSVNRQPCAGDKGQLMDWFLWYLALFVALSLIATLFLCFSFISAKRADKRMGIDDHSNTAANEVENAETDERHIRHKTANAVRGMRD